jgi:hypothetical protein
MHFSHQQLTLWYGTRDAPAPPADSVQDRRGVGVTVAVQPSSPSNAVMVRYRVDHGRAQMVRAIRVRTDPANGVEYFRAVFPDLWHGERVAYLPIMTCSGRTAPDPQTAATFPSSFRLGEPLSGARVPSEALQEQRRSDSPCERKPFSLEYLASVRIPLEKPEIIGPTPEGIRINWYWYPSEGVVTGPKLNAKVRLLGGDWMTIRRDGIGVMDVRATLETDDGAFLYVSYPGYFELGEDGYQRALEGRWPAQAPTRTTPRFHASHPSYLWLNRLPCLGIGEVNMKELAYAYDLYAVR